MIIPAKNELPNIEPLFAALPAGLRHVVLVDNGSTDGTGEAAAAHGGQVVREERPGYGSACLAGLAWLGRLDEPPAAVAFLDADLADDPSQLPRLWSPVLAGEEDLVLGQRNKLATRRALDPHQRLGTRMATLGIQLTTGRMYRDLGPMRVASWPALQRMRMVDTTWGWTVEMQFKAAALGLRVLEIDVPYRPRNAGQSKITGSLRTSLAVGWKMTTTIAGLWWEQAGRRASPAIAHSGEPTR